MTLFLMFVCHVQTHTRREYAAATSAAASAASAAVAPQRRARSVIGDYALNWKLSAPAALADEYITVVELSKSDLVLGTLEVLVFLQPTSDLSMRVPPRRAAGRFIYNVTMHRIGSPETATRSTEYPFVFRDAGPVELDKYFGY